MIRNLIDSATLLYRPPNILCTFYDGYFEQQLSKYVKCMFYCQTPEHYPIVFPCAKNLIPITTIPSNVVFDAIITHNRTPSIDKIYNISKLFNIPIIIVEHGLRKKEDCHVMAKVYPGHTTVYELPNMEKRFNNLAGKLIQTIPPDLPKINKKNQICISGDFSVDDCKLIQTMIEQSPTDIVVMGDNPRLSKRCGFEEYIQTFLFSSIYLHLHGNVNYHLLHAIGAGCRILAMDSEEIKLHDSSIPTTNLRVSSILHSLSRAALSTKEYPNFSELWTKTILDTINQGFCNENTNQS